jgi:hypothetical protein
MPDFAHAGARPSFAAMAQSFAPMTPAPMRNAAKAASPALAAMVPNVLSIETVRESFQQKSSTAVAIADKPAGITLRPGNVKASQRANLVPALFDELNHVYLHVPDPLLEAVVPVCGSLAEQLQPVSVSAKAQHTAIAGPAGAGSVEFFPMQIRSGAALPASGEADGLPEMAFHAGEHIWLEDPMTWRIPVSLAPRRSSVAMLPELDRALALEQFRGSQPANASSPAPLAWQFHANGIEHGKQVQAAGPAIAPAMVIELPSPRDGASAPLGDEVAVFDASTFDVMVPEIAVETGDLEMLEAALADSTVRADCVAPRIQDRISVPVSGQVAVFDASTFNLRLPGISRLTAGPEMLADAPFDITPESSEMLGRQGETQLPRSTGWLAMEAKSVLPAASPEFSGALAKPKLEEHLIARPAPTLVRNGAKSLNGSMAINLPFRAVRLKHGPEFFAAEPVVADSVARPISARAQVFASSLAMPEIDATTSDLLFEPAATQMIVPAGASSAQTALSDSPEALETASLQMPAIDLAPAAFRADELKRVNLWARNPEDPSPRHFGCLEPQLSLCLPESHYEEYPLALQVSVPEPRTVTVFETASYEQPSNVRPISEARPAKKFTVPTYMKGMAAGVMLASFLWFGSSSIKSDGITMRPGDLIRLTIQRRAVYEVSDNFHAGLASWEGKGFNKTWSYDKEGFIRPGRLALYKPSRDMSDYRVEFLTQIERKSVGWVFRAEDEQNYYAMKLAVTEPGPRPLVALVRYAVVDGKRESHAETPLQVMMHNNRPYRVSVDVKGNRFLTSIEGQVVDSWSDDRLKSGGVGLFNEGGEKARVYWLKVTRNSDFLGKLCSILVPKES